MTIRQMVVALLFNDVARLLRRAVDKAETISIRKVADRCCSDKGVVVDVITGNVNRRHG